MTEITIKVFFLGQMLGTKECITDFLLDCMHMFLSIILKFCVVYFISSLFCAEKKNTLSFWDKRKGKGCYFHKTATS